MTKRPESNEDRVRLANGEIPAHLAAGEMTLIAELREIAQHRAEECAGPPAFHRSLPTSFVEWRAADALEQSLAIARELARLATCMDALPRGSIGTQVALLQELEKRVGVRT